MEETLVKTMPDKEKARSILRMAETTLEMIQTIDRSRFPSHVAKEYYDVVRELMSVLLLLDGYKTIGEGAHKKIIEYLGAHYPQFDRSEISLIDNLRIMRHKITYDGFFVKENYIERELKSILTVIGKLQRLAASKL
ncbi:MAG: hypothetical protein Q8R53_05035 [Nanoarchaeota archaeon]|nr:hypothetical protein [Nanoarchaeota archaeon]